MGEAVSACSYVQQQGPIYNLLQSSIFALIFFNIQMVADEKTYASTEVKFEVDRMLSYMAGYVHSHSI